MFATHNDFFLLCLCFMISLFPVDRGQIVGAGRKRILELLVVSERLEQCFSRMVVMPLGATEAVSHCHSHSNVTQPSLVSHVGFHSRCLLAGLAPPMSAPSR